MRRATEQQGSAIGTTDEEKPRPAAGLGGTSCSASQSGQAPPLAEGRPKPPLATGLKRFLFVCAGLACVGMAYLGAILPGLPTTPWVLLAGYCFSRSSPRLERWLKRSPIFGKLLRDWDEHHGIRLWVKVVAVCMVVTVVTLSITLSSLPPWVKWVIGSLAAVGISTIVFVVPTIPRSAGK